MATSRGAVCCSGCRARLSSRLHHRRARRSGAGHRHLLLRSARVGHSRRLGRLQRRRQGGLLPPDGRRASCVHARDRPRASARTVTTPALDAGYPEQRMWGDVDGNGGADYCRRVGSPANQRYQCSLALDRSGFTLQSGGATARMGRRQRHRARRRDRRRQGRLLPRHRPTGRLLALTPTASGPASAPPVDPGAGGGPRVGRLQRRRQGRLLPRARRARPARCPPERARFRRRRLLRAWTRLRARPRLGRRRRRRSRRLLPARSATAARTRASSCTLSTGTGFGAELRLAAAGVGRTTARLVGLQRRRRPGLLPHRPAAAPPAAVLHAVDAGGLRRHDRRPARSTSATPAVAPGWTTTATARSTTAGRVGAGGTTSASPARSPTARVRPAARGRPATAAATARAAGQEDPDRRHARPTTTASRAATRACTRLLVKGVPRGATVKVTCKKGCSRKSYTPRRTCAATVSLKTVVRKRLKAGTTIKVVVSRPGKLAAIKTLKVRSGKRPTVKTG